MTPHPCDAVDSFHDRAANAYFRRAFSDKSKEQGGRLCPVKAMSHKNDPLWSYANPGRTRISAGALGAAIFVAFVSLRRRGTISTAFCGGDKSTQDAN